VVIDDGAPDDVAGAARPFLSDPRIRFVHTDNRGVSAARNHAVRQTRAPLIALLDGDDLFRPAYLETMVTALEGDASIRLATCDARMFGAVPRERTCVNAKQGTGDGTHGSLADVLDRSFNVYIGTTFRRADFTHRRLRRNHGAVEDLDLWVRLMMLGGRAYYANAVLGELSSGRDRRRPTAAACCSATSRSMKRPGAPCLTTPPKPRLSIACSPKTTALAFEHHRPDRRRGHAARAGRTARHQRPCRRRGLAGILRNLAHPARAGAHAAMAATEAPARRQRREHLARYSRHRSMTAHPPSPHDRRDQRP
jgi:hypothetical protein